MFFLFRVIHGIDNLPNSFFFFLLSVIHAIDNLPNISFFYSLAESSHWKVGVIEAGAYYPDEPKINVPGEASQTRTSAINFNIHYCTRVYAGLFGSIVGDRMYDWLYVTSPQEDQ